MLILLVYSVCLVVQSKLLLLRMITYVNVYQVALTIQLTWLLLIIMQIILHWDVLLNAQRCPIVSMGLTKQMSVCRLAPVVHMEIMTQEFAWINVFSSIPNLHGWTGPTIFASKSAPTANTQTTKLVFAKPTAQLVHSLMIPQGDASMTALSYQLHTPC